jgi:pimeloyl-ACP methyl ester carboxylesterase
MSLLILLAIPLVVYLAICAAVYFGQTAMLFPAGQIGPPEPVPSRAERLELAAASGEKLRGVHIAPARRSGERLLILGFGGNGWNGQSVAAFLAELFPEADVVVFHYRGYAPSEGRPGAAALVEDAPLVADFARARFHPARTVAVGFSIGSGVAASLAAHRPLDGLILVTPFDSLGRVAAGHYPWLPVRLLMRHHMEPAQDLAGNATPVALIAGGRDTLIPAARTQRLRLSIANLVFDQTIEEAGHNDIYRNSAFRPAIREALRKMRRQRP